jgi:hypothetical protein
MNTPLDEIKRLRDQLAEAQRQVAEKNQQLREVGNLLQKHLQATAEDPGLTLGRQVQREKDAFDRGYQHGDEMGWRRGVEHALMAVDEAHWKGEAHDHHGQMRELGLHDGPVPELKSPEEIVALSDRQCRIMADWWWKEFQRTHLDGMPVTAQKQPEKVREMRPKERAAEREAV